MSISGRYFIPGPVEVDSEVMQAMLHPMIAHRTEEAAALVATLQPGLQSLFGTERPVMLATGSATSMMEAAIRSGAADRVLSIVSGTFGERFAQVAERCDKEVVRLHVHRGQVLEAAMLDAMLDGPPFDAVTMVHSETSTGALAPVDELIARFRQAGTALTLVDAVSSVGGMEIQADRWNADFIFTGSQKAIGLPPGLVFAVASPRFLEASAEIPDRGFYLDVIDLHAAAVASRFPQTPALPVVFALATQLGRIAAEGLPARFARHASMRVRVEEWVGRHGKCGILALAGRRSDTITALTLSPGRRGSELVQTLAGQGWQVVAGIEPHQDELLRIGHMGEITLAQLDELLAAIEPLL